MRISCYHKKEKQVNEVSHPTCKSEFRAIKITQESYLKPEFPNRGKILKTRLTLTKKSTNVHYKVPVKMKGVLGKGFREEVGVLVLRLYVLNFKLSIVNMLLQKMVTHIYVFRVRVRHEVNCHLDRTLTILEKLDARIPKIRQ